MNEKGVVREIGFFLCALVIFVLFAGLAASVGSVPQGPNSINRTDTGRYFNSSFPYPVSAIAGNVTALVIQHTRVTEAWQGYYGNITGAITLDDAVNNTMYRWDIPDPQGEIYAANYSAVAWNNIYCMNLTHFRNVSAQSSEGPGQIVYNINMTQIELNFGVNLTDKDGLNETFNDTYTDVQGFRAGPTTIDALDGCSLAHPFNREAHNTVWDELLLTDNTSLVFTSIIRENADNFKAGNEKADFQVMVLENGHVGQEDASTTYYFFVEIY